MSASDLDAIIAAALAVKRAREDLVMAEEDLRALLDRRTTFKWVETRLDVWVLEGYASRITRLHSGGFEWHINGHFGQSETLEKAQLAAEAALT